METEGWRLMWELIFAGVALDKLRFERAPEKYLVQAQQLLDLFHTTNYN